MGTEREKALAAKEREAAEIERSRAAEAEALGRSKRLHEEAAAMHDRAADLHDDAAEVEGRAEQRSAGRREPGPPRHGVDADEDGRAHGPVQP